MKISPMRDKMNKLRQATSSKVLDDIELMLNNSKGTGTTNLLVDIAKDKRVPILVESEKTAETLQQFHPEIQFHPYNKQLPGQRVLLDVSTHWVSLREAQKIRMLARELLDWMDHKSRDW
jgi:hypothetical protein